MVGRRVKPPAGPSFVLDSDGLSKLAAGDRRTRAYVTRAYARKADVVVSAITLTEVLRGDARDTPVHRALSQIQTVPVSAELGRAAGELLGSNGMSGHRCAIDSVVAVTALRMSRPVAVLTSDPEDLSRLVEEPAQPENRRVSVIRV